MDTERERFAMEGPTEEAEEAAEFEFDEDWLS